MSSVRILCAKGHAEREIVKQVATPRGNCVGGLILSGGVVEAHSHMRAREDDACSRSSHGHGMGVYEEMRVLQCKRAPTCACLPLCNPWQISTDCPAVKPERDGDIMARQTPSAQSASGQGLCVCVRAEPSSEPRGLQCHVTNDTVSQRSLHCRQPLQCPPHTCRPSRCTCLHQWDGRGTLCRTEPYPSTEVLERLTWHCALCTGGPKVFGGGRHAPRATNVA